ncbi:MAG: hypothetical protein HOP17_03755 [Acidobacteria bacterium]|nr:hypothetical protein [Acidobacteriota bacterium]
MTVVLELKAEVEEVLRKRALANGFDLDVYLQRLIERDVERAKTLDEILAPVRKNFVESGMTEEELNEIIDRERQAIRDEKNNQRS